jgi:hypothetical protein
MGKLSPSVHGDVKSHRECDLESTRNNMCRKSRLEKEMVKTRCGLPTGCDKWSFKVRPTNTFPWRHFTAGLGERTGSGELMVSNLWPPMSSGP